MSIQLNSTQSLLITDYTTAHWGLQITARKMLQIRSTSITITPRKVHNYNYRLPIGPCTDWPHYSDLKAPVVQVWYGKRLAFDEVAKCHFSRKLASNNQTAQRALMQGKITEQQQP
jgi:hypothetical protein